MVHGIPERGGVLRRRITFFLLAGMLGPLLASCTGSTRRGPGVFFPSKPKNARIQYLTHLSSAEDVLPKKGTFSQLVFGEEKIKEGVKKPYGVAVCKGAVYVCDTKRSLINIFDLEGKRYGFLGFKGLGKLEKPINITIDERGFKYIADAGRKEVVIFDARDDFYKTFGGDELVRPVDVAIFQDKVFVCDSKACKIKVFDKKTLKYLYEFGEKGSGPGEFALPTNIAVDTEGRLYISDTINGRVQKVDDRGKHLFTYGRLGDMPGEFARPKGLAVDREGRLYVVDSAFENVQIFNRKGRLLLNFAQAGNKPGDLNLPAKVVVDYDNVKYFRSYADKHFKIEYLVIVTSQYGPRKVNIYGFGHYEG